MNQSVSSPISGSLSGGIHLPEDASESRSVSGWSTLREECHYHNAGTCPDCGVGMIRRGICLVCPTCGYGSCG